MNREDHAPVPGALTRKAQGYGGPSAHARVKADGSLEVLHPEAFASQVGKQVPFVDLAGREIGKATVLPGGVTVEVTTVHAAFDDDEENVGTHDLVKDLQRQGYAVVRERSVERIVEALLGLADQMRRLARVARDADYPQLAAELDRMAKEATSRV